MAEGMVVVDGTPIETTPRYKGCGCQRVTKRKRNKEGTQYSEMKLVFGWRLIALVDLVTMIPWSIKIVKTQDHEAPHLLDLVKQAQRNLEPYSRIDWIKPTLTAKRCTN
ncbi:hypothetical protein QUF64_08675 [Anaerolineales bacterium HSG6]|nr:hypothetical protein [Anaerolineales bacterium HSG6]